MKLRMSYNTRDPLSPEQQLMVAAVMLELGFPPDRSEPLAITPTLPEQVIATWHQVHREWLRDNVVIVETSDVHRASSEGRPPGPFVWMARGRDGDALLVEAQAVALVRSGAMTTSETLRAIVARAS